MGRLVAKLEALIKNSLARHRNFLLYGIIGASGALFDFLTFLFLFNALHIDPLVATALSTTLGITNNFILNVIFNFKVKDRLFHRFLLFYATGITGLLLSVLIIFLAHDRAGMDANIAKLASIPLIVLFQYIINSRLSMRYDLQLSTSGIIRVLRQYWLDLLIIATSILVMLLGVFYLRGFDEVDNLLGGKLIVNGQLPYADFFSHHMPGMYWLAALLYPFTHENAFLFRFGFNLILISIMLLIYFFLRKWVTIFAARLFLILLSLAHVVGYGQMALAESLVAYIFLTCFIVVLFAPSKLLFAFKVVAMLSLLLFTIPFMSLSYIYATSIIYMIYAVRYIKIFGSPVSKDFLFKLGILTLPYIVGLLTLVLTGTLSSFLFSTFTFNSTYYAPLVGQTGGGILQTTIAIVVNSLEQLLTLVKHLADPNYTVQLLILAGFLGGCLMIWRQGKKTESLLVASLLLVINPLINIFNTPGITSSLANHTQHSLVYTSTALLLGSVAVAWLWRSSVDKSWSQYIALKCIVFLYVIIVGTALLGQSHSAFNALFVKREPVSLYAATKSMPLDPDVQRINDLLDQDDYTWIGPANFDAQLYMEPKRATKYTFFMPWQDSCQTCRKELLQDFLAQKPKIIIWANYVYKGKVYKYHQDVDEYLKREYFTVKDPRLAYYHFLRSDKENLSRKLEQSGYVL